MTTVLLQACIWQKTIDSIPGLCWGVIGLCAFYLVLKYIIIPRMNHHYDLDLKDKAFGDETYWHEVREKTKDAELERRIREFQELTLHQKMLDKVIEKKLKEEIGDIKKSLDDLNEKYKSLDGEIEKIIIKKKQ